MITYEAIWNNKKFNLLNQQLVMELNETLRDTRSTDSLSAKYSVSTLYKADQSFSAISYPNKKCIEIKHFNTKSELLFLKHCQYFFFGSIQV